MKTVKDITYSLKDIEEKGYGVENNIIEKIDVNIIAHFGNIPCLTMWQATRLKELCKENEKLQKQINNTKKTAKIKEPKRLSKKQCDRLVKKYCPKKRKRI